MKLMVQGRTKYEKLKEQIDKGQRTLIRPWQREIEPVSPDVPHAFAGTSAWNLLLKKSPWWRRRAMVIVAIEIAWDWTFNAGLKPPDICYWSESAYQTLNKSGDYWTEGPIRFAQQTRQFCGACGDLALEEFNKPQDNQTYNKHHAYSSLGLMAFYAHSFLEEGKQNNLLEGCQAINHARHVFVQCHVVINSLRGPEHDFRDVWWGAYTRRFGMTDGVFTK